jgi:phosphodiesterase/alkaline phosphatase D-like protein
MRIHERYRFGDMLDLTLLDDRQYRSHPPCGAAKGNAPASTDCEDRTAAGRTMLGLEQERWFDAAMAGARGRWTVVAQQTLMAELDRKAGEGKSFWMDGWDGNPGSRDRLLGSIAAHRPSNPVVISGDVHAFWVADLKQDFADPASATLASEIVGTSITSQGPSEAHEPHRPGREPALRVRPRRQARLCPDDAGEAGGARRPVRRRRPVRAELRRAAARRLRDRERGAGRQAVLILRSDEPSPPDARPSESEETRQNSGSDPWQTRRLHPKAWSIRPGTTSSTP